MTGTSGPPARGSPSPQPSWSISPPTLVTWTCCPCQDLISLGQSKSSQDNFMLLLLFLTRYMFLSANDRVMRGKKGTSGVHIMKTVQAIIVSVYHEPILAEQVGYFILSRNLSWLSSIFSAPTPQKSLENTWLVWATRDRGPGICLFCWGWGYSFITNK